MKIRVTESQINSLLLTLLVFLDMNPFFVWPSVSSLGYRAYTGVIVLVTIYMAYQLLSKKRIVMGGTPELTDRINISLPLFLVSAIVVILFFYEAFCSGVVTETQQPFNAAMLCIHLGLMLFILQDNITLQAVFLWTKKIFALSLIPAIIAFLLIQVGIAPPSTSVSAGEGVVGAWRSYDLFFGTAVMIRQGGVAFLNRLCGMFQEPGFVGTMGALFLLGDKLTLKKWENMIILIAGVCSFSLAFVLLLILGIVFRLLGRLKTRKGFLMGGALILAIAVGYFVFMGLSFDENSMLGELQGRLEITEEGLAGDNRFGTSEQAMKAYDEFLASDLTTQLLGYGKDSRTVSGTQISIWMEVHSYKEFVFGFGFLGLGIMLAGLAGGFGVKFNAVPRERKWNLWVLLIVFLISIYQRYDVTSFCYYCVLFGGGANLALMPASNDREKRIILADDGRTS